MFNIEIYYGDLRVGVSDEGCVCDVIRGLLGFMLEYFGGGFGYVLIIFKEWVCRYLFRIFLIIVFF